MSEFKDRLKELRKELGMTQQELAEITFSLKTQSIIGKWEQGANGITSTGLVTLSKFFDVTTDYLLGLSDERKTKVIEKSINLSEIPTDDIMREVMKRWLAK